MVEPFKGVLDLVNDFLQPLIEDKFQSKTFPTANEVIEALARYVNDNSLRSTALFVNIHIHNLRSTLPHHLIIAALNHFFRYYKYCELINGISPTTIIQLVQMILSNQFCMHEDKLYQQTCGSFLDSPLITTLIDIFLFHWQYDLLRRLGVQNKRFFGRCHNQIFFVWNESKDNLLTFLQQTNSTHSYPFPLRMTVSINTKIQYLDAEIGHLQGILQTRVYHHSVMEPYALPYLPETKTSSSRVTTLLHAALIRAILYCSNIREFENERLYIELSFLFNDVSLSLIQMIIENFLFELHLIKRSMHMDEVIYRSVRSRVRENYQQQSKYHIRRRQRRQWY